MRILFVGTYFSSVKGSKSVAEKLAELFSEGYTIELCSSQENKVLRMADILFRVFSFKGDLIIIDVYSGPAFFITFLTSIVAKRIRKKKLVLVLRGGKLADYHNAHPSLVQTAFRLADKIITPSLFLKEYFSQHGYRVEYLPNFVLLDRFKATGTARKPFSMLWVRSFRHIYNPELAIQTLIVLLNKYPETTLTMIGPDGGLLATCKKLIDVSGIQNKVNIVGPVSNNELAEYYSSHAVYLNTTSYESFGMAVMEAAACGIPIVSTAVGEIPFLWANHENMLLIEDFSPQAMADCVAQLFADPKKSAAIADRAIIHAHSFSWPAIRIKWEQIFQGN